MARDHDDERLVRGRPIWPFIAIVAVAIVLIAAAWAMWPRSPDPTHVLVVVHGCPAGCQSALSSALRAQLSGTFEVVLPEEGEIPATADASRDAAADAGAEHALFVDVEMHERRNHAPDDAAYSSATLRGRLLSVSGEPPREIAAPRIGAYGLSPDAALTTVVTRGAETLAPALHVALLERAVVREYAGSDVATEEVPKRNRIEAQLAGVERVREELAWMAGSCEEAAAELAREAGPGRAQCISHACAEEYAFDLTRDGRTALVHAESPGARIPMTKMTAERVETEETLEVVPLGGGERRVIARSDNYYTYPTMSADGRSVVAVEDWSGGMGLVLVEVATGTRTVLGRFDRQWVQAPMLSPDASQLFYRLRATRRAPAQLLTMPARRDADARLLGEAHVATWVEAALGGRSRAYVAELVEWARVGRPPDPLAPVDPTIVYDLPRLDDWTLRLALFDPSNGNVGAWLDDDRHQIEAVAGSFDGKIAFTWKNGEVCGLGVWDPTRDQRAFSRTPACLDHPRVTADGFVIGTAALSAPNDPSPGDDEVVQVRLSDGALTVLTANALRDRYPRVGGTRVVFDRIGTSRYRHFPRVATCWLDRRPGGD